MIHMGVLGQQRGTKCIIRKWVFEQYNLNGVPNYSGMLSCLKDTLG